MQRTEAQQAQLNRAQVQAELQEAQITSLAQAPKENEKDISQELKIASLKQQGILTDEEYQQTKGRILSRI